MDFSPEWEQRLQIWMQELPKYFYEPLGAVSLEGFTTFSQLAPSEAVCGPFSPMPVGTEWGAAWEYGWFRGALRIPESAAGKRVVLRMDMGGEALIWINGQAAGAKDKQHTEILLAECARGGETFEILAESYAGHGPRLENGTPCPPDTVTIAPAAERQVWVNESTFGIWNEDAYQLWMDWQTLWQLRCKVDPASLRFQRIDEALRKASLTADFERETSEERNETFRQARQCLAPALACHNGSTAPVMFTFGQSHLDLAWLWPWQETQRKSARTVSNQLALLEEYPNYRFLWCEPPLYLALKERYPALYARVRERMEQGRIFADGAVWVECDTNLPAGESLIRQILYGRRFYREELNTDSRVVWLPDCFGFSASLPQIMRGCGVKYFATQKIVRNYNGGDPFPYNIFQWEGIDGTRILTHIFKKNNAFVDPETVITRWREDRIQKEAIDCFLYPFGYGDGGGGPVRDHVEFLSRMGDLEGMPRMQISTLREFFDHIAEQGTENRYVGELYFQCHRGTYTSQALIKRGNRKSEFALREAELWGNLAGTLDPGCMERLWKKTLFNQFHDVLPGASIQRVCQEARESYREVIDACSDLAKTAQKQLAPGEGLTVWNSLSWPRTVQVVLPGGCFAAVDSSGGHLPCQTIGTAAVAKLQVPACGYTTLYPLARSDADEEQPQRERPFVLENEFLRLELDEEGRMISAVDRECQRELLAAPGNCFRLYRDTTVRYEAWDIDHSYMETEIFPETKTTVSWVTDGPLRQTLRVEKHFSRSSLIQEITLSRGQRRVEFETTVDWHEHHKLLKVAFPTTVQTDEALHEIQYGYIKRPTHRSRQYDKDRFEVVNHKYTALREENRGVAVLNDCKYGVSVQEGTIALTLLRAPKVPDMYADMGRHQFTYAFTFWNGSFLDSAVVREGYELNVPVTVSAGQGERSFLEISDHNVILDAVKAAEDGSGDLILRLYESKHASVDCTVRLSLSGYTTAWETDLAEEHPKVVPCADGVCRLRFRPFEIKTIRLRKE